LRRVRVSAEKCLFGRKYGQEGEEAGLPHCQKQEKIFPVFGNAHIAKELLGENNN